MKTRWAILIICTIIVSCNAGAAAYYGMANVWNSEAYWDGYYIFEEEYNQAQRMALDAAWDHLRCEQLLLGDYPTLNDKKFKDKLMLDLEE